jgi:hypothetical protein
MAAAAETGRALLTRPSVRASLEAFVLRAFRGPCEQFRHVAGAHQQSASEIVQILRARGVVPNRIGVDGLPGSGKSTLSRALADTLGFEWKSLDHQNMNVPRDFTAELTIYEHHRLLRTQDVDAFDVIISVDERIEVSKARILKRAKPEARRAVNVDVLDFEKLRAIGKLAFEVCDGDPIPIPASTLVMKIRPPGGFNAVDNIMRQLHAAGHGVESRSKEEMLFLLAYGRARSGLLAYFVPSAFNEELMAGLLAGVRTYLSE